MIKTLGKYTYGDVIVEYTGSANVKIGKYCSIAGNIHVWVGGNHRTDYITTYPFGHVHKEIFSNWDGRGHPATNGDVIIGNDVWIASNVTIMSGVTIGDGVVIAANSHVVKNAEPYSLIGGNPARFIKFRFTEEQIAQLLEIKWWDWKEERINRLLPLLCSTDADAFIRAATTVAFL